MTEQKTIEKHPLKPFFPAEATLLMLGSFPPKKERWSMDFYYPNMQNDMWRIFGLVFFNNKDHFLEDNKKKFDKEQIKSFLSEKGIALSDTALSAIRLNDNASDKFLEIVEPINLQEVLNKLPHCKAIVTTGQKATDVLLSITGAPEPNVGKSAPFTFEGRQMYLYRMPSSSRAYPKPLPEKAEVYKLMLRQLGLLTE